nr:Retrotransposon domain containing protein [Haemonchus contortus]
MVHEEDNPGGDEEDECRWEKFWELESAGIHEFGNPEREEKDRHDKQVWDNFNLTVERRADVYYVKLPWKDDHPQLPDNYAIAIRRLHSVWNSLQKDQNLLQRYDAVSQEQIQMNILEDVTEERPSSKTKKHYLAHQALVTPNKLTTKLRIVFDASAHYKGCPSLNEVLHRGPVILPQLFGILLRFRIGRIGIIANVEKAFLQVRLHESERDFTRCLWLWDYRQPPEPNNIRCLRFTRVAFGLTASPFLLAATTHYHLDTYSSERDLVQVIKNNLYVDNVLLTAENYDEARYKYIKCKEMFNALSINLREFVSNDEKLMQGMIDKDRSADPQPKVLGIRWNSLSDRFQVNCSISTDSHVSKRTVARAVASIYDPLGWLIPLTHKAKRFLQSLWKEGYGWDSTLSASHIQQWHNIIDGISGFEKAIPRVVARGSSNQVIATFADASLEAMAACLYLCDPPSTHLLMARERLPSLRTAMTMPKMELNAVTLATRLTETVVKELRSAIQIKYIYIFSDSEIVLSWVKNHHVAEKSVMVTNRLREIGKIVEHLQSLKYEGYFGYVDSIQNPADCATRGLRKNQFTTHFWWKGPAFLEEPESNWKKKSTTFKIKPESDNQERNVLLAAAGQSDVNEVDRYLITPKQAITLTQTKRILAYALRFIKAITRQVRSKHSNQVISASWWTSPR